MPARLIVSHKQLGDILLLQPAIDRLAKLSGAPVTLLTRSGMRPLVNLMPGAIYRPTPGLRWYSEVFCLDHLRKSTIRAILTPATRRTLVLREEFERASFHRFGYNRVLVPGIGDEYVARYYWKLVADNEDAVFSQPALERPPTRWAPDDFFERKWIVINPTSGWKSKNWTVEKWKIIVRHLLATTNLPILITSGGQEWQVHTSREIHAEFPESRVLLLGGQTTLQGFIWLVANASLVVTVDGLASHLSTAYRVPSVTLFGPTSVGNWHLHTPLNLVVQAPDLGESERFTIHLDPELVKAAIDQLAVQQ